MRTLLVGLIAIGTASCATSHGAAQVDALPDHAQVGIVGAASHGLTPFSSIYRTSNPRRLAVLVTEATADPADQCFERFHVRSWIADGETEIALRSVPRSNPTHVACALIAVRGVFYLPITRRGPLSATSVIDAANGQQVTIGPTVNVHGGTAAV